MSAKKMVTDNERQERTELEQKESSGNISDQEKKRLADLRSKGA